MITFGNVDVISELMTIYNGWTPTTDYEAMTRQERKEFRELQTLKEHLARLQKELCVTEEERRLSLEKMWAKHAAGEFPLPFTDQCEAHRSPVLDALEDLRDTERGAVV